MKTVRPDRRTPDAEREILREAFVASGLPQAAIEAWFGYSAASAPSLFGAGRYPLVAFLPPTIAFETTGIPADQRVVHVEARQVRHAHVEHQARRLVAVALREGLERTIDYYRKHKDRYL